MTADKHEYVQRALRSIALSLAPTTPRLTPAQLDKMVELHDRYKLSYRAIGVRYGIGEKMAMRLTKKQKEGMADG